MVGGRGKEEGGESVKKRKNGEGEEIGDMGGEGRKEIEGEEEEQSEM